MSRSAAAIGAFAVVAGAAAVVWWTSAKPPTISTSIDREASVSPSKPRVVSVLTPPPLATASNCPIAFDEVSRALGLAFEHQRGDNGDHWLPETMGGGAAWFDLDGDGWQDLYFIQGKRAAFGRDRVFLSVRGARFVKVPDLVVPADPEFGQGVTAGDYDNDGFDDLYVANFTHHRLYRNNGDGTLSDATSAAGLGDGSKWWGTSAAFGDLDLDGDLDLIVCNYAEYVHLKCNDHVSGRRRYCGPDSYTGRPVTLLANLGDGRFRDDSKATGMGAPLGKCLGVVVARLLGAERPPQVFIANDLAANFLFLREGESEAPTYRDVAKDLHVAFNGEGVRQANMGVAVGDYDRDGRLDLFSTHYYQEHDTLWKNEPGGFRDVTRRARLYVPTLPQLSWGTQFFDADNDGWLDLFVTSGNINNDPDDAAPYKMTAQVFWNRGAVGDEAFDDVGQESGAFFRKGRVGRGSATADFDRDGKADLVVVHHHENVALLRNVSETGAAVGLEFVGRLSPRDGLGVRVAVQGPRIAKPLVREINGGGSYLSADARALLVGVGADDGPFELEVSWPNGAIDRIRNVRPGAWLTIAEGDSTPISLRPFATGGGRR